MNQDRIEELKVLAEKATPGPWVHGSTEGGWDAVAANTPGFAVPVCVLRENRPENATFIAATREAVPDLIAAVEELAGALRGFATVARAALQQADMRCERDYSGKREPECQEQYDAVLRAVHRAEDVLAKLGDRP